MADLEAVIAAHDRSLRALAYRLLGDRDAMDDVLQDAYGKAVRGMSRFRGESAASTWLYRIVYNACLDELRRRRPEEPLTGDVVAADVLGAVVERDELTGALALLPVEERAAVLLVDADGFDYATAARILGVPAGTVASRLNRARTSLRRVLRPEGAFHV
jgi:RNA polymerase sigma-70 factor (ECF subfamily)